MTSSEPTADDWAGSRGDKWHAYLSGFEAMLAPVDEPLIQALSLDAPYRIADIGCGGGGTALHIVERAPKGTTLVGFDLSPNSVAAANRAAQERGLAASFKVQDVAATSVDEPYQRLTSRFGVMFFSDPKAAFSNLLRWLKPDGRLAFAVWSQPKDNPWMTTVRDAAASVVELPKPDPDAPGLFRYADASKLIALLNEAGYANVEANTWRGQLAIGGGLPPTEAAHFALVSFSSFAEQIAQAGPEAFKKAHEALTVGFSQNRRDNQVWMNAGVHMVTATRPR